MKKKGQVMNPGALLLLMVAGVVVVAGGIYGAMLLLGTPSGGSGIPGGVGGLAPIVTSACGDDGLGTIKYRLKNDMNETNAEWYGATVDLYRKNGENWDYVNSADTNANDTYQTFSDVACNFNYRMVMRSADGASGDNNFIEAIDGGNGAAVYNSAGVVDIAMNKEEVLLTLHGTQHATLSFRMYDNKNKGLMYDTGDSTNSEYELTGIVFTSTSSQASAITNMTVDDGGDFDVDLEVKAVQTDTKYAANGDNSVIVAVNADVGSWERIIVDCGNTVEIQESALTAEEQDLWNAQEFFFAVNKDFERLPVTTCNIVGEAKNPVTTWKCPVFTFATKGNYVGTLSGTIESGSAAQDDSSNTAVYTVQTASMRTNACSASS